MGTLKIDAPKLTCLFMFIDAASFTQIDLTSAIIRNPLVVTPDLTVMEAIAQMSSVRALCQTSSEAYGKLSVEIEARSSCVAIVENHQLIGILTERDVVRLITQKSTLETLPIRDVMTRGLITLRESEFSDLFAAIELLRRHKIRHLPILDEHDCLVGLLTHESLRQVSRPVDLLRVRATAEVMTTQVVCADPHTVMREIACRMTKHQVSSVVIVQPQSGNGQKTLKIPIGIVTERDVVQFQALGLDFETAQVQAVMSAPIFSVQPEDSLWIVQQLMEKYRIQRLVVTGAQGELLGIVTQTSLLQALNPLELYNLAKVLEGKVLQLEAEKIQILQNRANWLEHKVEERTTTLQGKAEREKLIATISSQIRVSLELPDILNTTVEEVRGILGCDRVSIWQFQSNWQLLSVAESVSDTINPQVGKLVYDSCCASHWAEAYRQGRVRVVPDIYTTEMADCHRELLEQLQTRAKVLIPIIQEHTLWGLLEAAESHAPRQWQSEEVELLEQLATQLAIAIQQASSHQQLQTELQERQQLIAQLQESEQRYATLASMVPVGIFRTDASGYYTYTNERWHQISGLTQEAALGNGWQQGVHPDDRDRVVAEWCRAIQENHPFSLEYPFQCPAGGETWVYGQAVAERNANGDLIGYVGTITDISDRKQAEINLHQLNQTLEARIAARTQQLQAREAQLFDLFDNATDLIQSVSLEGQLLFVNRAWQETLGYSADELEQLSIFQIIHPDDLAHCQTMMARLFAGEDCFGLETRFLTKDGREITVEGNVNCQVQDGQPIATRGIFRNVTDRKRVEEEIQRLSERLTIALTSGAIGCWEWDIQQNILVWDQRMYELYGVEPSMSFLPYDVWSNRLHPDDRSATETLLQQAVLGQADYDTEFRVMYPDGSIHFIKACGALVHDTDGISQRMIGVNFDISKLKLAEVQLQHTNQELVRATRLKDEFLANMSHELRTPLNAILGMTEGLQENVFGVTNEKQVGALQTIERSGLHLLSLINDILDVAKVESGQIELEYTSIAVTQLCSSSLAFIKQLALQKHIRLETKLAPDLTNIFVDERRIRQVLINLLSNAVKFTPQGGTVTLTSSRLPQTDDSTEQHYLRIAVIDTGIGIAPQNLNKLFQPFVQIDSALNRQYTGTGLGLALVKKLVELHGGRVAVTSELGMGSCFTIDLPCEPKCIPALNPPMQPMTGQDDIFSTVSVIPLTAPLILLAEDNEANIITISSYLTAKGYRLISAKDGKEAIAMAIAESPDLILMDIQMPGMDGLAAIRQLRHDPNFGNVPIVALTALAMASDRERCLEAGANDYLSKPIRLKELTKTIHQLLNRFSQ